ncbi:MAG: thiamine pyrophosphate-dependent enzyme [Longimicrobiales bacterium]
MNFAQVFDCPAVFICQNNQWAISVPRERQTKSETLAQKGVGQGMRSLQVDGNDVLALYAAVKEAVDWARDGDGPTFIEAVTYRLSLPTTVDGPSRYRREEEAQERMAELGEHLQDQEHEDDPQYRQRHPGGECHGPLSLCTPQDQLV